jgi:hypothetical protein
MKCLRCQTLIAGAVCVCLAAENVPAAREHIPVPDISRIADNQPHTENGHTAIFVREPVRAPFSVGFTWRRLVRSHGASSHPRGRQWRLMLGSSR